MKISKNLVLMFFLLFSLAATGCGGGGGGGTSSTGTTPNTTSGYSDNIYVKNSAPLNDVFKVVLFSNKVAVPNSSSGAGAGALLSKSNAITASSTGKIGGDNYTINSTIQAYNQNGLSVDNLNSPAGLSKIIVTSNGTLGTNTVNTNMTFANMQTVSFSSGQYWNMTADFSGSITYINPSYTINSTTTGNISGNILSNPVFSNVTENITTSDGWNIAVTYSNSNYSGLVKYNGVAQGSLSGDANGFQITDYETNEKINAVISQDSMSVSIDQGNTIPALASGVQFSKTLLKPGSGLTVTVQDFSSSEYLAIIPYNIKAYSSYSLSVATPSAAAADYFTNVINAKSNSPALDMALNSPYGGQILIDGRMRSNEKKNIQEFAGNIESRTPSLKASSLYAAKAPAVGDTKTFWCLNSNNWPPSASDYTSVTAKLVAIGTHCYIYEDQNTPGGYQKMTDSDKSFFQNAFDNNIYPKNTAAFGSEPNPGIDGDTKIYILFTYNVNTQSASGYFDSVNQLTQAALNGSTAYNQNNKGYYYYSNEKEIFYMNVPTTTLNGSRYQQHSAGVLAHEFQHMINYNVHVQYHIEEEVWLNEGLSQVAQDVCGYGYQYGTLSFVISPFLNNFKSYSLLNHEFSLASYGYDYLFTRYLVDRGVTPGDLVNSSLAGKANVEARLKAKNIAGDFDTFYSDFLTTLFISNRGWANSGVYNFTSINLRATQADGTNLNGITLTNEFSSLPVSYNGSGLKNYGFNVLKCNTNTTSTQKIKLTDPTNGGIGVIVLRIKK